MQLVVDVRDGFGEEIEPLFHTLGSDIEVPARFRMHRSVFLAHRFDGGTDTPVRFGVHRVVVLPHRVEQVFQLLVRHRLILLELVSV